MVDTIKEILRRAETWPQEDQDELVEVAREIEARRNGAYQLTRDETTAVELGLGEMQDRKFASDVQIEAIFRKARSSPA